jgi:hypothetical protein
MVLEMRGDAMRTGQKYFRFGGRGRGLCDGVEGGTWFHMYDAMGGATAVGRSVTM